MTHARPLRETYVAVLKMAALAAFIAACVGVLFTSAHSTVRRELTDLERAARKTHRNLDERVSAVERLLKVRPDPPDGSTGFP
jgi:sensor domain CHASE-containing protein